MVQNRVVTQDSSGHANSETRTNVERSYAGFWIRFVALLIDTIALQTVFVILSLVTGTSPLKPPASLSIIEYVIALIYYVTLTVYFGQTLGKMILGVRVVRNDGKPLSWGAVLLREIVGKFVSGIILLIGYIIAGMDSEKRALHDRMAGTRVVKKK
ncbi:RDD family protein [Paenibacillus planticolens]|uniref:RDD family protein n=1 Tax=Paenibacillus planticolens TaxID=2654976 RepID=A0ABX1ZJS5_9BACL|nr:RDD family protein [Paenibacillus planticolens]NOV00342.1 RDD family protein [Paenibacillus planticolens]